MERPRFTGLEIPAELYRMVGNPNRPWMVLHATEPTHPGGVIYKGLKLDSFSLSLDVNGVIQHIGIVATQEELGRRYFKWYPENMQSSSEDRIPLWLEVYYGGGESEIKHIKIKI